MQQALSFLIAVLAATFAFADPWRAAAPCFEPGRPSAFDSTAVKDPTIVHHDGRYHLFYTARGSEAYTIGYAAAESLANLNNSRRHQLSVLSEETGYAAAPQVFYFAPQSRWYLVYQTHGLPGERGRYTPMYVTSETINEPGSWSEPEVLVQKFERDKWIDFWIICDETTAYLFYTRNHEAMYYMTTPLDAFPEGFANPVRVEGVDVHEAVCVYKIHDRDEYAMLLEINDDGRRHFTRSTAPALAGPWSNPAPFAHGDDLVFPEAVTPWTTMVSHGELIRTAADQRLEIPPLDRAQFLIQGTTQYQSAGYAEIPWSLGLIRNYADGE